MFYRISSMSESSRRDPGRAPAPMTSEQELMEINNGNLDILTDSSGYISTPMTSQQFLDNLSLATILGGSQANDEVFNAFYQTVQNNPNNLSNTLNATPNDPSTATSSGASPPESEDMKPAIKRETEEILSVSFRFRSTQ